MNEQETKKENGLAEPQNTEQKPLADSNTQGKEHPRKKVARKKPEERQTGKDNPFIAIIKDKAFTEFKVLNTANAWWKDTGKVQRIVDALKFDASVEELCSYAGISNEQWRYFNDTHPDFSRVEALCREVPNLKARQTVVNSLDDPQNAFRYLAKKKRKEFGESLDITSDGEKIESVQFEIIHKKNEAKVPSEQNTGENSTEQKEDNA